MAESLLERLFSPLKAVFSRWRERTSTSIIDNGINEGAKALTSSVSDSGVNSVVSGQAVSVVQSAVSSHNRLSALQGAHGDRSHQMDKLRATARHMQRRENKLTQAQLTHTRLQALAESLEPKKDDL